jgi:hypothetical protein
MCSCTGPCVCVQRKLEAEKAAMHADIQLLHKDLAALVDENARLRSALEWYADGMPMPDGGPKITVEGYSTLSMFTERAREALGLGREEGGK